jgi:hypothetical protein
VSVHRIRLQGPWQVILPGAAGPEEIRLPASWRELFGETFGTAVFQRKFNQPTNLTSQDQLRIRLPESVGQAVTCELNGHALPADEVDPFLYRVTQELPLHNVLSVTIQFCGGDAGSFGILTPVHLEIHSQNERGV